MAELLVYGVIGDEYDQLTAIQFAERLRGLGDVPELTVRINSPGGSVFDGVTMYNLLAQHKAAVTVEVDGLAASAASVVAMAGDRINMAENAMLMIHNAWMWTAGNAVELRRAAELLDTIDSQLVRTYAARTKLEADRVQEMMAAETWLSSDQALEAGFVDEVTPAKTAKAFDLTMYRNTPQQLLQTEQPAQWRLAASARELELLKIS